MFQWRAGRRKGAPLAERNLRRLYGAVQSIGETEMKRVPILVLVTLMTAACGDTDVDRGGEAMTDTTPAVEPVQLDTIDWFTEGRDVMFNERSWVVAGEPVIDPIVERVGEFEGTPLYAEVNTAPPYNALYIPLEDDYWQLLEEGPDVPVEIDDTTAMDTTAMDTTAMDTTAMDTTAMDTTGSMEAVKVDTAG